ncbi:MAG: hypothetical protein H8E31_13610, partial [Planctomycetes bacterium]|nr:hypothetical protein [Planctomycetota bacterium]
MNPALPPRELLLSAEDLVQPRGVEVAWGTAVVTTVRSPDKETVNEDACLILDLGDGAGLLAPDGSLAGPAQGGGAAAAAPATLRGAPLQPPGEPTGGAARGFSRTGKGRGGEGGGCSGAAVSWTK